MTFFCQREVRDKKPNGRFSPPIKRCSEQCFDCECDVIIANASTDPSDFLYIYEEAA